MTFHTPVGCPNTGIQGAGGEIHVGHTAVSRKVVGESVRDNAERILWVMVAYSCLIEFHGVLARRKKNL